MLGTIGECNGFADEITRYVLGNKAEFLIIIPPKRVP